MYLIASRALGGNVGSQRRLPHLRVSRGRDECGFRVYRQREPAPADERADPDAAATGHGPHFPRDDRQVGDRPLQSLGGKTEERLPSRRRRLTDCRASAREPRAPTRAACVRTLRRVAVDDADTSRVDAELFGRHLRDGDAHAGPDVHLAREDRDRAVGVNREKAVDLARVERPSVATQRDRRRLMAEQGQSVEAEAHDEAARRLEPVASIHVITLCSQHFAFAELRRTGRHAFRNLTRIAGTS